MNYWIKAEPLTYCKNIMIGQDSSLHHNRICCTLSHLSCEHLDIHTILYYQPAAIENETLMTMRISKMPLQ